MSVLTDVVVADVADAQRIGETIEMKAFKWIETPHLTVAHLGGLFCVLGKRRFSKKLFEDFPVLFERVTAVTKISDDLVKLMAKVKNSDTEGITILWIEKLNKAEIDGWIGPWDTLQGFEQSVIEERLVVLCKFSQEAIQQKKSLLLRQCP